MEFTPVCYNPEPTALVNVNPGGTKRLKKQSPAEQARWVRRWQKSGMTQTAFCRQYGLAIKTFSRWKCNAIGCSVETSSPKARSANNAKTRVLDENKVLTSAKTPPSGSAEGPVQFQACMPNGVVLKFDAVPAATAIHLVRELCDAHSTERT